MGGYNQIEKVWVDLEVPFRINEYDGSESIQYVDEIGLIQFKKTIEKAERIVDRNDFQIH